MWLGGKLLLRLNLYGKTATLLIRFPTGRARVWLVRVSLYLPVSPIGWNRAKLTSETDFSVARNKWGVDYAIRRCAQLEIYGGWENHCSVIFAVSTTFYCQEKFLSTDKILIINLVFCPSGMSLCVKISVSQHLVKARMDQFRQSWLRGNLTNYSINCRQKSKPTTY